MRRLSELLDIVAISAIATGLGNRFGWWLAAVVAGVLILIANYVRASS